MIPLSSQQRLQYKLGLRPADHAIIEMSFEAPCTPGVGERIERWLARLPNRWVDLQPAGRYDATPALFSLDMPDIGSGRKATIGVTRRSEYRLEISFAPLLWDVFSILRIVRAALEADSVGGEVLPHLPLELLQQEALHTPSQIEHVLAEGLGLASPKSHKTRTGSRSYCASASPGALESSAERLVATVMSRCLYASALVRELPVVGAADEAVGNLSYFIASDAAGRPKAVESLADQLVLHAPLASHPDKVAAAVGLTMLPHLPGIDRITVLGTPCGLAAHLVGYLSKTGLHVSASYAAAEFDDRESIAHFNDVMTSLRGGASVRLAAAKDKKADKTIAATLAEWLAADPQRTAVSTSAHRYSRAELLRCARATGAKIPSEVRQIGICCANSFEFVAAVVACVLRGICYVPLDPNAGTVRLRDIVSSATLEAMLCTPDTKALASNLGARPIVIDRDATGPFEPIVHAGYKMPVYRIYTSGTTGTPKPVDVFSDNLQALFKSYEDISPTIYRAVWGFTSSIGFDASVKQYLGPLLFGGIVFIPARSLTEDPVAVLHELKNNRVAVLNLTPQLLRIAVDAGLSNFEYVLVSGDVLPPRLVRDFFERSGPATRLINLYGPTETTINATFYELSREFRYRSVPIGRALGDSAVEVQDAAGVPQPYCIVGSLRIFGDIVTGGHRGVDGDRFGWRDGHASFDTGDQCFVWYDDLVYFVGRDDAQVKVNGVRVNLHELTQGLRTYLDVATCYIAFHRSRLFVVLRRGELLEEDSRVADLRNGFRFGHVRLTPLVVDEIPINVNGKVDLDGLLATEQQAAVSADRPMVDVLDLEVHTLLHAVAEQRGLPDLGMDDNLFAHGCDSLLTMELALELNGRFGLELAPAQLVTHPTARQLAALLRSARRRTGLIHTMGVEERERLVVLLPPVLGNGLIFLPMAMVLVADHLVAVCSYPSGSSDAPAGIERIASAVISELRKQRLLPRRIDVVGYSMGASVGFELCRQLGPECRVASLNILDKPAVPRDGLLRQQQAGERLVDRLLRGREPSPALRGHMLADLERNIDATFRYRPCGSIFTPVRLFICAREEIPVQADEWAPHLRGGMTVIPLQCRHEEVLDSPHIDTVLAALHAPFAPLRAELQEGALA
jgi:non-ribosomal peptide synthetase component F/thioesterase domain-containing protein/acyl carrier protein